ncbi:MAG TPA: sulfurtransferase [Cryomorphaceae bacterium]|nr:sulfurtransferase [Cryomorphaceae bacterium]
MHPLIETAEFKTHLGSPDLVIINAGSPSREAYAKKHIEGALYADLNDDLSEISADAAEGGRHPLPSVETFAKTLAKLGITPDTHVVIYDDKGGANAAARFWWMLRSIGHEKVQVLNGGLQAAERQGIPTNDAKPEVKATQDYPVSDWHWPLSNIYEVEKAADDRNSVIIDVREAYRYKGESEPIDLIAGHIPGAINIPLQENLDKNGMFLSPKELRRKYGAILHEYDATIHCGSGVTACHTILALDSAGFDVPKLYVGSWSEWSRNEKPIGKEV